MAEQLHVHRLFQSRTVSICDVRCRPHCSDPCGEEWADAHEVIFPRRGVFVQHEGRRSVIADGNQVLFLNRDQPYCISHPIPGGDDCTVFTFAPDVLLEVVGVYDPSVGDRPDRVFSLRHGPLEPEAALLHHKVRRCLGDASRDDMAIEELGLELLEKVVGHAYMVRGQRRAGSHRDTALAHRATVDATKTLLSTRLGTTLSLDDVARAVHCSRFHLARLFRRHTGLSIHEYRNRLRLAEALERLCDGGSDLTELAMDLGYSSHSHFSAAFRRKFGTAPSQFRRTVTTAGLRKMSTILTA